MCQWPALLFSLRGLWGLLCLANSAGDGLQHGEAGDAVAEFQPGETVRVAFAPRLRHIGAAAAVRHVYGTFGGAADVRVEGSLAKRCFDHNSIAVCDSRRCGVGFVYVNKRFRVDAFSDGGKVCA